MDVLLSQLEGRGLKVCVLTRGYGRTSSRNILVNENSTASEVGDEPLWLYRRHPQTKIAVGADRIAASKLAGADVDIFILEDGLQHLQVHRDFEITLVDATRPLSHYRPLPWGLGREGFEVLKNSDLVILTRSNQADVKQLDDIADVIFKNGAFDLIEASIEMDRIYDVKSGETKALDGVPVALVSAVGNPESFENLVKTAGLNVAFHVKKADHYQYISSDLGPLEKKAGGAGAQALLVTEKDSIKIQKLLQSRNEGAFPWGAVSVRLSFDPVLPDIYDLVSHSSH